MQIRKKCGYVLCLWMKFLWFLDLNAEMYKEKDVRFRNYIPQHIFLNRTIEMMAKLIQGSLCDPFTSISSIS